MFSEQEWQDRLQRQEALEDLSGSLGKERFARRVRKAREGGYGSTEGGAKKLLIEAIEPTEALIQEQLDTVDALMAARAGSGGRPPTAHKWVKKVGADVAAFMVARATLDSLERPQELPSLANHVAKLILHELRYRRFREKAPGLFHYRMQQFDTTSYAHRSRSLNAAMSYAEVDVSDIDMSPRERVLVGTWLIHKFMDATRLVKFTTKVESSRGKTVRKQYVVGTRDTLDWITDRDDVLASLQPVHMPMVAPPLKWSASDRGGYRFAHRAQHPLIRRDSVPALDDHPMPVVYDAVNRMQDTPWRINQAVYDLIVAIEDRSGGMCGIPTMDNPPPPTFAASLAEYKRDHPDDEAVQAARLIRNGDRDTVDAPEDTTKAIGAYHRHKLGVHRNEAYERRLEEQRYRKILMVANELSSETAFWFPYNCDFRGRVYPISDYLSPQGQDIERALLTFTDKRPMGPLGGKWLAVHTANTLDELPGGRKVSTMTLIERQAWVEDNLDLILKVARDPFGDRWWMEQADEPLQFYAACVAWSEWEQAGYSSDHLCGLPVAVDGSCNGLQHFAAAFRDEIGAVAVNVCPNERPEDVYAIVADAVKDRCEQDLKDPETRLVAKLWLSSGLIDRSLTKRPTMTFGYGSKKFGFTMQITEYLTGSKVDAEAVKAHFTVPDPATGEDSDMTFAASQYMAGAIWDALKDVVVKAFEGMTWLQACARAVAKSGNPVSWVVPGSDFPVVQGYYEVETKRIDTILSGSVELRLSASYYERTDNVEVSKQASGVAPNVIHSLDAAALMLTVQAAWREGIESFGMVHDSYATVPGDAELLGEVLRQEFVGLYQLPVMDMLSEQWQDQADEALPTRPSFGVLDVSEVIISEYFFA